MATSEEIRAALRDQVETDFSCRYGESDLDVMSRVESDLDDLDWCMRGSTYIICTTFEYNRPRPKAKDVPRRNRRRF